MDGYSSPPMEAIDDANFPEPEFLNAGPPSPFDDELPPRPRTPSERFLEDLQRRMPIKRPIEVELLRKASSQGRLQDVHQILSQYLLTQVPDSTTGRLRLGILCDSILEAIAHNHLHILSYLFFMRVGEPFFYLKHAIDTRSHAVFEVFLQYGWDINKPVERTMAPALGYISDSKELSKWFLDHGADPNAPCAWDFTSMSEAMYHASLDTIQMLFSRGGDITRGQLLHNAVWRDGPDTVVLVDLLLRKGALINEIQYQQHPQAFAEQSMLGLGTPLHYAVETNREDLVTFLISHGADPSIRNTKGRTAFDIADIRKNVNISQILRKDRV